MVADTESPETETMSTLGWFIGVYRWDGLAGRMMDATGRRDRLGLRGLDAEIGGLRPKPGTTASGEFGAHVHRRDDVERALHTAMSGTVDVAQQGRIWQLDGVESLMGTAQKVEITFGDFGLSVWVSPPTNETDIPPRAEYPGSRPGLAYAR
jgi:hypothetical protein